MTPDEPGGGACPPTQQLAGVKRKGGRRTVDDFVTAVSGGGVSVVEEEEEQEEEEEEEEEAEEDEDEEEEDEDDDEEEEEEDDEEEEEEDNGDRCRSTLIQENRVTMPGFSMSGYARGDRRPANAAAGGPGAAPKAAALGEEGENRQRISATRGQRISAAADASAERAAAAARYMRGEWTPPQPAVPFALSASSASSAGQPHRYLEIGATDRNKYGSLSSVASAVEVSPTGVAPAASTRRPSNGRLPCVNTVSAAGSSAGAAVLGSLVAKRTPPTPFTPSAGGKRNPSSGLKASATRPPPVNVTNDTKKDDGGSSMNRINSSSMSSSTSSTSRSTSNHLSSAESFVGGFLADDVRPCSLPFAPPEAWSANSSVNLGQASRTSSAASMMMMMMFGVGVGADVSSRFDANETPFLGSGGGGRRGGGGDDGRDLAVTVAGATAAILCPQRSSVSSGGDGSRSSVEAGVGIGGGLGSPSPAPVAAAAPPSMSHTNDGPAQPVQGQQVGRPALIEHGQHGETPEQLAPVQARASMVAHWVVAGFAFVGGMVRLLWNAVASLIRTCGAESSPFAAAVVSPPRTLCMFLSATHREGGSVQVSLQCSLFLTLARRSFPRVLSACHASRRLNPRRFDDPCA